MTFISSSNFCICSFITWFAWFAALVSLSFCRGSELHLQVGPFTSGLLLLVFDQLPQLCSFTNILLICGFELRNTTDSSLVPCSLASICCRHLSLSWRSSSCHSLGNNFSLTSIQSLLLQTFSFAMVVFLQFPRFLFLKTDFILLCHNFSIMTFFLLKFKCKQHLVFKTLLYSRNNVSYSYCPFLMWREYTRSICILLCAR